MVTSVVILFWLIRPILGRRIAIYICRKVAYRLTRIVYSIVYRKCVNIEEITKAYEWVWAGPGKKQRTQYYQVDDNHYNYAVTHCNFHATFAKWGCPEITVALCRADRDFWAKKLKGTGVTLVKSARNIADGEPRCFQDFFFLP